jgi:two-component system sensor histidine kinase DesK
MSSVSAEGQAPRWLGSGYPGRWARLAGIGITGVWLLYLAGSVAELVTNGYGVSYIIGGLAIIVAFCTLYLVLVPHWMTASERLRVTGLGLMVLLAVVFCVFYGQAGAVVLWIFLSSATGLMMTRPRWALRALAGCVACYVVFSATTHVSSTNFLSNLLPVTLLGVMMIGLRRHFQLTAELRRARGEVAQLAANEERLRLARDMHDLTGQSLSMITLKAELAARLLSRLPASAERDRVQDEIEQVAGVSRQTLKDIREAISGYRRPTLAVEVITARAALASVGITARDEPELTLLSGTFDPDAEAALAWCLREAVTNVVRHSGAANCRISLIRTGTSLMLTVRDDGFGHLRQREAPGSGLRGMSERLSAVGGSLQLRPDADPGFCLTATVPAAPDPGCPVPSAASPQGATLFGPLDDDTAGRLIPSPGQAR